MISLRLALFAAPLAVVAIAACSSATTNPPETEPPPVSDAGTDTATSNACPADLPPECPTPAPSWAGEVQAIIASRCGSCHYDGGQEATDVNLQSYAAVYAERGTIESQVNGCRMPPAGNTKPTDSERQAILGWLVCGAPNN